MAAARSSRTEFNHGLPMTVLISILYPLGPAAVILAPLIVGGVIDDYSFTDEQAGLIASMDGLGLVIGLLVGALWVRKVSWTKALFVLLAAYAAANALSIAFHTAPALLAMRLACGFCGGSLFAIVNAALGDNRQPDRAFGIAQSVQGVMMFGAFAAVPLLSDGQIVNSLFLMLAGAAVVLMLLVFRFPQRGASVQQARSDQVDLGRRRGLIWIGLFGGLLYYASIFGFWAWIERIGINAGLDSQTVELALGISQIAAVAGGLAAGFAGDRFGRIAPLLCAAAGQLVVLWMLSGSFAASTYFIGASLYQGALHHRHELRIGRNRQAGHQWQIRRHNEWHAGHWRGHWPVHRCRPHPQRRLQRPQPRRSRRRSAHPRAVPVRNLPQPPHHQPPNHRVVIAVMRTCPQRTGDAICGGCRK